jgi:hypothetical protein
MKIQFHSSLISKVLEVRDAGTFIPVLAINMQPHNEEQRYLMRRVGYPCDGRPNVILTRLSGDGQATNDPYAWTGGARTFPVAHNWIIDNWADLKDGDVIDVQFILGETPSPKMSERCEVEL